MTSKSSRARGILQAARLARCAWVRSGGSASTLHAHSHLMFGSPRDIPLADLPLTKLQIAEIIAKISSTPQQQGCPPHSSAAARSRLQPAMTPRANSPTSPAGPGTTGAAGEWSPGAATWERSRRTLTRSDCLRSRGLPSEHASEPHDAAAQPDRHRGAGPTCRYTTALRLASGPTLRPARAAAIRPCGLAHKRRAET
jgi:hypothetical protein